MSKLTTGGIGFPAGLFLVFLGLKLCGIIGWSWWWVFAPFWLPVAIAFAVPFALIALCLGIIGIAVPVIVGFFLFRLLYKICTGK